MHKRTNNFPVYRVLGNLALCCVEMCVLGDRWLHRSFSQGGVWWRHVCSSGFLEESSSRKPPSPRSHRLTSSGAHPSNSSQLLLVCTHTNLEDYYTLGR